MARISSIPQAHPVFNELDSHGILLGLPRLELERNKEYKRRLLDVMVHRANSSYRGLIYGITRELGLELKNTLQVTMATDSDGVPILPLPAITLQDTKCTLYRDLRTLDIIEQFDRWEVEGNSFTLNALVEAINSVDYFTATLLPGIDGNARSMTLFNQTSVESILAESIGIGGPRIQLQHQKLIDGTVTLSASNLRRRVATEEEITQDGDYYINLDDGMLLASAAPAPGSNIRYQYAQYDVTFVASPVILYDLQSADFQTKMFQTLEGEDHGLPTALGADIINELLSVYPITWGR